MKYTKKLFSCKIQGLKGKVSTFIGNFKGLKQCINTLLYVLQSFALEIPEYSILNVTYMPDYSKYYTKN